MQQLNNFVILKIVIFEWKTTLITFTVISLGDMRAQRTRVNLSSNRTDSLFQPQWGTACSGPNLSYVCTVSTFMTCPDFEQYQSWILKTLELWRLRNECLISSFCYSPDSYNLYPLKCLEFYQSEWTKEED